MKLLSKTRISPATSQGAPLCGCIAYIDSEKPLLMHRIGHEVASDVHDDFYDTFSNDNGQTWNEPRLALQRIAQENGHIYFVENALYYSADHNRVVHFVDEVFQRNLNQYDLNHTTQIRITIDEPQMLINGTANTTFKSTFGLEQGLAVSLCHPFADSKGRLLVPVQWQREDEEKEISSQGFPMRSDLPNILKDVWQCALLIGTWNEDHALNWQLGNPVPYDFQTTSRGLCEGTVAELSNGQLAMILRGSNAAWPEKPGYKWLSFSDDGGLNWSHAEPLHCDNGSLPESSATGSALFRSEKNGQLYWIGNLCLNGERAGGNWPRSPLYIAEVQEEPFRLIRESIMVIDERTPHESEFVQHSNFKYYQDRETNDVVLYLTRFGERGHEDGKWLDADLYQYRIRID
jgi:hypothetical protein